ncbi:MAG TPA: hypothetical protein VHV10_11295 [Ktedonobacteraceae bacterium]|nr:hypothetical protein [Ktedonobacteraceae bacterium]
MPKAYTYEENRKGIFGYFESELYAKLKQRAKHKKQSLSSTLVDLVEKSFEREEQETQLLAWLPELEQK